MKVLSIISGCAVFSILMSLIIIVIASTQTIVETIKEDESEFTVNWGVEWGSILIMMGMAIYAFEGIGLVIPCEAAITKPSHYNPVLIVSLTIASLNYIFIGFIAYIAFGTSTCDIITHNLQTFADTRPNELWHVLTIIVTLALIITIAGTFPLQLFVVTDIIEEFAFRVFIYFPSYFFPLSPSPIFFPFPYLFPLPFSFPSSFPSSFLFPPYPLFPVPFSFLFYSPSPSPSSFSFPFLSPLIPPFLSLPLFVSSQDE